MITVSNKDIIGSVAGNIYRMHPYHMPEDIDKIMAHLVKTLNETPDYCGDIKGQFKLFKFNDCKEFEKWLEGILKEVPEYQELNVSRKLKEKGVKYGDPENSGFVFTSRYDQHTQDDRYSDFIDLGALIGNICGDIIALREYGDDCFLCKYAKRYGSMKPGDDRCSTCVCNPEIKYKREPHPMSLKPKKDWTEEGIEKYKIS